MFKSGDYVQIIDSDYLRFIYNTNPFSNSKNYPPSIYGVIDGDEIARNQFPNEIRYFVIITYINDKLIENEPEYIGTIFRHRQLIGISKEEYQTFSVLAS